MKRVFEHPPARTTGKQYWRSLEEHAGTDEFREWIAREFPAGAAELEMDGVSRRNFLQLMGASLALAGFGLSGCRRPESYIVPYTKGLEWVIPGKQLLYATSMPRRRGAIPLVVTTHEGRPTKIEGNSIHPIGHGGTDAFAQASVLDLYDPDRSKQVLHAGKASDLETFTKALEPLRAEFAGGGLAVLAEESDSPTRARLRTELESAYPGLIWSEYEAVKTGGDRIAAEVAFGKGARVRPNFDKADVILSLGSDFLGTDEGGLEVDRAFARRRRPVDGKANLNRLYVVENRYTVTGGMADHRYRAPLSHLPAIAAAFASAVGAAAGNSALASAAAGISSAGVALNEPWIKEAAADLVAAKGRVLVMAGSQLPVQVQILAHAMNAALGALGSTLTVLSLPGEPAAPLSALAAAMSAGTVKTLVILGGNPAYNAPVDMDWATLASRVPHVIRLGLHVDESSAGAEWHLPAAHYLEAWGDARSADGTVVPVQPLVEPLWGGISEIQLLAMLAGTEIPKGPEIVKATILALVAAGDPEVAWTAFLRDGFLAGSALRPASAQFSGSLSVPGAAPILAPVSGDAFEVVFVADSKVDDGRYINNGWLQELPDPVTRLTWDNAALLSPAMAKKLGIEQTNEQKNKHEYHLIQIEVDGRSLEIPALVAPGHADNSITISLGYGRKVVGRVGSGTGANAYSLRTAAAPTVALASAVKSTGAIRQMAVTHGHWTMEGRDFFREATVPDYEANPAFAKTVGMDSHIPPNISLYSHPKLDSPEAWAMAIDLSACTGCSACVIACQSENNIPIVGREQVINQREMHWIRIDRYFASVTPDEPDPEMVTMPVACQHCENAPCETVCPVNATVHSTDGLNVMVYNRCIGTRYCANNCPYKVRRFNFFDYNKRDVLGKWKPPLLSERSELYKGPWGAKASPDSIKMQKNPNVTVRMRGVMEKCSFCVQRIESARIESRVNAGGSADLKMPTDIVKAACQQACPSEAIVFGDKNDPASQVAKLKADPRHYNMLEYLNVLPRLGYLARVRNPNPKMPDAASKGQINRPADEHGAGHGEAHGDGHAAEHGEAHGATHDEKHGDAHAAPTGAAH